MIVLYYIFCCALWIWTNNSITSYQASDRAVYVFLVIGFLVVGSVAYLKWKHGILIPLMLANVGASIAYRTSPEAVFGYFRDMNYMCIAFVAIYLVIRYTKIYQWKIGNLLCMAALPVILLVTRLTAEKVNGAYLDFFGMQIFGLILMAYPFVIASAMAQPEKKYLRNHIRSLSMNLVGLLGYTFVLFIGCAICNEFGLLLVLAMTATIIFYIRCRNIFTKMAYSGACLGGAFVVSLLASHVQDRMRIWLDLKSAAANPDLQVKAETVLYLFRNFNRAGFWGNGIGNLPKSIYTTLNSDHAFVTLIHDFGLLMAILVLILGVLLVKWMLFESEDMNLYDRYLNLSCGVITGLILLIHIASNLGSFVTAGVGFPWVSDGTMTNMMFTVLLAIHCGVNDKKRGDENEMEESEFW